MTHRGIWASSQAPVENMGTGWQIGGHSPFEAYAMNSDRKTQRLGVAAGLLFGIASGVGFGAAFGAASDNVGAGIAVGVGFGVALGSAFVLAFGSAGSHRIG